MADCDNSPLSKDDIHYWWIRIGIDGLGGIGIDGLGGIGTSCWNMQNRFIQCDKIF